MTARQLTGWGGEQGSRGVGAEIAPSAFLQRKLDLTPLHFLLDFVRQL